jgi:Zn-dependent M16 (insulinase) family peptidase
MGYNADFELIEAREVEELRGKVELYRHINTGAELLSVQNDEEDKVFGVAFQTVPTDSTGVAHILEHVVLTGSKKYPIKEPFVELLKGSLASFVNAMTFPDHTVYPVASQNLADFYNLIDVYLDAVLHPLLLKQAFQQEGWHFELSDPDQALRYKGVVFNEMKGNFASANYILYRETLRTLFPDTAYFFSSAGDPLHIPDLGYEDFSSFYGLHYHPSNARIFFIGNDPPAERIALIGRALAGYRRGDLVRQVSMQTAFSEPKRVRVPYPLAGDGKDDAKHIVGVSWMFDDAQTPESLLSLEILNHILMGTTASALRKVLIESGLGEEIFGTGYNFGDGTDLKQLTFTCGLRGVPGENVDQVESLILETLAALVREGIDPSLVEASLNTIEFELRECNFGGYPRGLGVMMRVLPGWIHGGNPIDTLAFHEPLMRIKERAMNASGYFENMVAENLVGNPHRVTLHLEPDGGFLEGLEASETARLAHARKAFKESELQDVIANTGALLAWQETPDRPEDLAKIPILAKEDLDRDVKTIPLEVIEEQGSRILFHDLATSGIGYVDMGFNVRMLPLHLLPYVPLYGRALVGMGTALEDYVALSLRIGRDTGGIRSTALATGVYGTERTEAWLFLRGKALVGKTPDLFDILRDVLLSPRFDQQDRFRQIVLQEKARIEAGILQSGHQIVNSRLQAGLHQSGWAEEQFSGLEQLFFIRDLVSRIESDWGSVVADLEMIHKMLVNRGLMLFNMTMESSDRMTIWPDISSFLAGLPTAALEIPEWPVQLLKGNEGLAVPAQVNYVGAGVTLFPPGETPHGSWFVANGYLRNTWLWESVRVKGGAYGAFVVMDSLTGMYSQLSYRDPNILETLANFDRSAEYLLSIELDEVELLKSIIGAVGKMDEYQLPDAKGFTSMMRNISGLTDPVRQQLRDELLATRAEDFQALGASLKLASAESRLVVLGPGEGITEAFRDKPEGWLKLTQVM